MMMIVLKSVTLGDEEASRRGIQKTVLERKGPSTFSCAAEIVLKIEVRVHHSLEATVDALLAGFWTYVLLQRWKTHCIGGSKSACMEYMFMKRLPKCIFMEKS
ncbi:protein SEEDLING PLASTID DEVELOPMENT 1-like isoform X2 [Zingiber officinale]|uniref:protein SEEDLING PLASTID DEVELOPMENT 1-like isoform X2 n=1 Tax=Zingiber officinale TaxID=94328 RepID=UPI001C4AE1E2|nr:protein SEEDLING PLASTID DEVELOPMENT 1-like isoform X2 [Zingiber officinale]